MGTIAWTPIGTVSLKGHSFDGTWHVVAPELRDITHLRIIASGSWSIAGNMIGRCSPDGLLGLPVSADRLILPDAPAGALIGRIGGSSASLVLAQTTAGDVQPASAIFAIGTHCILALPDKLIGPLFVGVNWRSRPVTDMDINIEVKGAALP